MKQAREIWQRFAARPGATVDGVVGIASEHAVAGLIRVIERYRPRRILELGAGIGTLTYTLLATARRTGLAEQEGFSLLTIENEPFCLEQLPENLADFAGGYRVAPTTEGLKERGEAFDLLVVDGGGDLGNDLGVQDVSGVLRPGAVVLVEGGRMFQRTLLRQWYGHRPHLTFKSRPLAGTLRSEEKSDIVCENKPYHLLIFEPSLGDRLRYPIRELAQRVRGRLLRPMG